ncbi:MAG: DUF1304 family protein, partial [Pseudomonadota bacterium]
MLRRNASNDNKRRRMASPFFLRHATPLDLIPRLLQRPTQNEGMFMHTISKILTGVVALIHVYILVLEMFLWESRGPKVFESFPADLFAPTKAMA